MRRTDERDQPSGRCGRHVDEGSRRVGEQCEGGQRRHRGERGVGEEQDPLAAVPIPEDGSDRREERGGDQLEEAHQPDHDAAAVLVGVHDQRDERRPFGDREREVAGQRLGDAGDRNELPSAVSDVRTSAKTLFNADPFAGRSSATRAGV
jgi:hypothetical protein